MRTGIPARRQGGSAPVRPPEAPPSLPEIHTATQRHILGVVTHRVRRAELDATRWRGIPVTTVPRILVDLAAVLPEDQLARAVHEAEVRHHTTPNQVDAVLVRRHNWPGARKLRRVIWGEVPVSLSRLESRFLERLRDAGLPLPETNGPRAEGGLTAAGPITG